MSPDEVGSRVGRGPGVSDGGDEPRSLQVVGAMAQITGGRVADPRSAVVLRELFKVTPPGGLINHCFCFGRFKVF